MLLVGPAGEVRGEVPRQIERVGDAGVHAVAGVRHPEVRGVAGDEDAPVAEAVGDEAAADPVFLADDLVREVGADAEDGADARIAVDRLEVFLARHQVVVDEPGLVAVDREADAAAARVARVAAPGALAADEAEQLRRADVGRLHALDHRRAGEDRADRLAHQRSAAVAADQVARPHASSRAAVEVARRDRHAALVLHEAGRLAAVPDRHAGLRLGVREQDRLEVDLVDAVRRLGRRPPAVGAALVAVAGRARGDVDARQLAAGDRRCERRRRSGSPPAGRRRARRRRGRGGGTAPSFAPRRDCTSRSAARRARASRARRRCGRAPRGRSPASGRPARRR